MNTIPLCTHRYIGLRNSGWAEISVFLMVIHYCTCTQVCLCICSKTMEPIKSTKQTWRRYPQGQLWLQISRSAHIMGHEIRMVDWSQKYRRKKMDAGMWDAEAASGRNARAAVEKSRSNNITRHENRQRSTRVGTAIASKFHQCGVGRAQGTWHSHMH